MRLDEIYGERELARDRAAHYLRNYLAISMTSMDDILRQFLIAQRRVERFAHRGRDFELEKERFDHALEAFAIIYPMHLAWLEKALANAEDTDEPLPDEHLREALVKPPYVDPEDQKVLDQMRDFVRHPEEARGYLQRYLHFPDDSGDIEGIVRGMKDIRRSIDTGVSMSKPGWERAYLLAIKAIEVLYPMHYAWVINQLHRKKPEPATESLHESQEEAVLYQPHMVSARQGNLIGRKVYLRDHNKDQWTDNPKQARLYYTRHIADDIIATMTTATTTTHDSATMGHLVNLHSQVAKPDEVGYKRYLSIALGSVGDKAAMATTLRRKYQWNRLIDPIDADPVMVAIEQVFPMFYGWFLRQAKS